jgi:hypothetical protein
LPIGVNIPEQGSQTGLIPHAQWHWGPRLGGRTGLPSAALVWSRISLLRCGRGA